MYLLKLEVSQQWIDYFQECSLQMHLDLTQFGSLQLSWLQAVW